MRGVRRSSGWRAGNSTDRGEDGSGEGRGGNALSVGGSICSPAQAELGRGADLQQEGETPQLPGVLPAPALSITRPTSREQKDAETTSEQGDAHTKGISLDIDDQGKAQEDAGVRARTRRVRFAEPEPSGGRLNLDEVGDSATSTGAEQSGSQAPGGGEKSVAVAAMQEAEEGPQIDGFCWWIAADKESLAAREPAWKQDMFEFEHYVRGHIPFSSACEVCLRARSCKPAVRRSDTHENEVQLDQFFEGQSMRFLAVVHSKSFAVGCVCGEDDRETIIANIGHWLSYLRRCQQRLSVLL